MAERTLDEIIQSYQEANDRLQSTTPPVQPVWTPPPAPMPQYPAPQILQQATQLSYLSMRMTPPMLSLRPSPGRTGMFTDPYEAAIQEQMAGQAGYMDPAGASSFMGRGMVRQWGERWGGVAGAGVGAAVGIGGGPAGMVGGASWGASIGGALGEYLPDVPLIGPAISWGVGQLHAGAAEQLSGMARLQQGTRGHVQMGQQQAGLGGTGMSGQAALDLTKRLQGMETEAFNVNDLINLTVTGAQTGMLMGATDIATIADRVKGLMRIVGEMARLTGDPDFRRSLQQIADLRRTGFSVEQAVGFIGELGVYGRMAGMAPGQVMQAGGMPGGQIFQQYGMAPAPGIQAGAANLAAARAGVGGLTPIQQGLFGGPEAMGQRATGQQAQFMTQFMRPMLSALVQRGEGGEFELDPERMRQLPGLLGEGGFGEMLQRGGGAISQGGPGDIARFMRQLPELQSEFAQQYAGGIQGMMTASAIGMGRRLGFRGKEAFGAGVSAMFPGDPAGARQFELMATNKEVFEEGIKQQAEERQRVLTRDLPRRRERREGLERQIEAQEEAQELAGMQRALFGREIEGPSWWQRRQARVAQETMRETERTTLEAQGLQKIFGAPMPVIPERMRGRFDPAEAMEFGPTGGIPGGAYTPGQMGVLGIGPEHGRLLPEAMAPGPARFTAEYREEQLRGTREAGEVIERVHGETREAARQRETIFKRIWGKLGLDPGQIGHVKADMLAYASKLGRASKGGLTKDETLGRLKQAFINAGMSRGHAEAYIRDEGDMLFETVIKTVVDSNDPGAKLAVRRSKEDAAQGKVWELKGGQDELDRLRRKFGRVLGIVSWKGEATEEHMAGMQAFYGTGAEPVSSEAQRAALIYFGKQLPEEEEARRAAMVEWEGLSPEEQEMGRTLGEKVRKLGGEQLTKGLGRTGGRGVEAAAVTAEQYRRTRAAMPKGAVSTLEAAGPPTEEAEKALEKIGTTEGVLKANLELARILQGSGGNFKTAAEIFFQAVAKFIEIRVRVQ